MRCVGACGEGEGEGGWGCRSQNVEDQLPLHVDQELLLLLPPTGVRRRRRRRPRPGCCLLGEALLGPGGQEGGHDLHLLLPNRLRILSRRRIRPNHIVTPQTLGHRAH